MKVLLVSGVACIAWMTLVQPAFERMHVKKATLESHNRLIASYTDRVGSMNSDESIVTQTRLEEIMDRMNGSRYSGDAGTALHGLINESAAHHGVSVSRIESMKARQFNEPIPNSDESVLGINQMVRIEVEGDYDAVMSFMDEVVLSPIEVKFDSFRFIPIGHESIRVNAEVSSVLLTAVPELNIAGGLKND